MNVGAGMKEIGYFYFPNSDTWSVKTNRIEEDGTFYVYAADTARMLDVFHVDLGDAPAAGTAVQGGGFSTDNVEWLGANPIHTGTSGGKLVGDHYYVTDPRGLFIYDASDPAAPEIVGSLLAVQTGTHAVFAQEEARQEAPLLLRGPAEEPPQPTALLGRRPGTPGTGDLPQRRVHLPQVLESLEADDRPEAPALGLPQAWRRRQAALVGPSLVAGSTPHRLQHPR